MLTIKLSRESETVKVVLNYRSETARVLRASGAERMGLRDGVELAQRMVTEGWLAR